MTSESIRVAVVQSSPVYLHLHATVRKTCLLIDQAAALGAKIVAFPETWIPGYPAWLDCCRDVGVWDNPAVKRLYARLFENSVLIPGPEISCIAESARSNDVVVVLGVQERVADEPGRRTLYNSLLILGRDGAILNRHRKIMPTFTERLVWGEGDGQGIRAVDTGAGRLGGLICWEHWMPLTRHQLHQSGEDIHVAMWPQVKEMNLVASRHYAFEGRCFVLACGGILTADDLPGELEPVEPPRGSPETFVLRGGSAIIGPDGGLLAGPIMDRETILTADLELGKTIEESLALDVTGHYSRPDLFKLVFNPKP